MFLSNFRRRDSNSYHSKKSNDTVVEPKFTMKGKLKESIMPKV